MGVYEVPWKLLCMIGCKSECYTLQGLSKITFGANIRTSILKGSQFSWKSIARSFIPTRPRPILHAMMSLGVRVHFQSSTPPHPSYLHICISFSFTLPRGRLIVFWIAYTKANIIRTVGCSTWGVHSLLYFAYTCVQELFIGGEGLFTLQKGL